MMAKYRVKKKNRGISLLEVVLSISIIALVLVMATRFYSLAHFEEQVNDTASMIQSIRAASQHWLLSHNDFTDISVTNLIERNLLPKNFAANPWGGGITVGPSGTGNIKITVDNIPVRACLNLQMRFRVQVLPGSCQGGPNSLTSFIAIF